MVFAPALSAAKTAAPQPRPTLIPPSVIGISIIDATRAAAVIRSIYPSTEVHVDRAANALIVVAPADEVAAMRTIVAGIDVKSPTQTTVDTIQLHNAHPSDIVERIRGLFPHARLLVGPNHTVIVAADPNDAGQIRSVISAIDTPPATPTPKPRYPAEAVRVTQSDPRAVARAVSRGVPNVGVAVSGSDLLISGAPDDVSHAKALVAQLDLPPASTQFTQLYRLRFVDASSVADLLRRSFPNTQIQVDKDLNALTVLASPKIQRRIADGIDALDAAPAGTNVSGTSTGGGSIPSGSEVISLRAAVPGLNGSPSTSASDIATTVSQALSNIAPDLKVTVPPNSTQLVLTGSPYSISEAKALIEKLDTPQPLVVLDTEVLEVDETTAKNLGIQLTQGGALISSTFTEQQPPVPLDGGPTPPLMRLQGLSRTPITFGVQLNLLIQQGKARILADPRISTISGRTASIRAGDTLAILTTTGGGPGTIATTQLQTFQTGVTLDITPVVNAGDFISVTLHPSVNSLSGILNGVPQISTRDTITTVGLMDNQTLVIGGLIQENTNRTSSKIPLLGDAPLIGKLFQNSSLNSTRNELIITVTPHIVQPGENNVQPGPPLPAIPTPEALPTLAPGTVLPAAPKTKTAVYTPGPVSAPPAPAPNPTPVNVPTPASRALASASAAPQPLPTAFNQTNVFTYGAAPSNNYAQPGGAVQIYYVQVQPTVVKSAQSVTISAITSTNVDRLTFGANAISPMASLSKIGPGQWQSTFPFSTAGLPASSGNVQLTLTAQSTLGGVASLPIPFSLAP